MNIKQPITDLIDQAVATLTPTSTLKDYLRVQNELETAKDETWEMFAYEVDRLDKIITQKYTEEEVDTACNEIMAEEDAAEEAAAATTNSQ